MARKTEGKTKLDQPRRQKILLDALKRGFSVAAAIGKAGISLRALSQYRAKNAVLDELIELAKGEGYSTMLTKLYDHALGKKKSDPGDAELLKWLIERMHYRDFGRRNADIVTKEQLAVVFGKLAALLVQKIPPEHHAAVEAATAEALLFLEGRSEYGRKVEPEAEAGANGGDA